MSRRRALLAALLTAAVVLLLPAAAAAQEQPGPTLAQVEDGDGFGENQVVDRYGIPVFEYSIEGRQGGGVDGTFTRLGIWLGDVLFSTSRLVVVALIWLLDFALDFGLADLMLTPVQQLIGVYETNFVDRKSVV